MGRSVLQQHNFFQAMFGSGMKEADSSKITLGDVSESVMKIIVKAMYKLDVSDLVTGDILLELLAISHRFDLDFHEDLCLLLRTKWLEWDGFHVVYSAAQEFCDVKLQETCLLFC